MLLIILFIVIPWFGGMAINDYLDVPSNVANIWTSPGGTFAAIWLLAIGVLTLLLYLPPWLSAEKKGIVVKMPTVADVI